MAKTVVYGQKAVGEALRDAQRVSRVLVAKESRGKGVQGLLDEAKAVGVPFDFVPQAKINELVGALDHQGVAAIISPIAYATLDDCLEQCGATATLLLLDQVQHPKNFGMIIRSAYGAGAAGIVVPERGGALVDDDVIRASAGAALHVPIVAVSNLSPVIRRLKDEDFWVYGLTGEEGESMWGTAWPPRVALVVGNETAGIRPGLRKTCDVRVRIPLKNGLDSLNVAVATSVALFHVAAAHGE